MSEAKDESSAEGATSNAVLETGTCTVRDAEWQRITGPWGAAVCKLFRSKGMPIKGFLSPTLDPNYSYEWSTDEGTGDTVYKWRKVSNV